MHRPLLAALLVVLIPFASLTAQDPSKGVEGIRPVAADGHVLNLDFETGTLQDWKAEGEAFAGQPVEGDVVQARRGDMHSRHQGRYWIGTYERKGDLPQGTLTSLPFKVTQPWASFLVGGGPHDTTCVELVRKDTGERIFRATGLEEEDMRRIAVDLKAVLGKEIFIRLVDRHSGHWGHVNFDDFRFHATEPAFPRRPAPLAQDEHKFAGLPPLKAAAAMTVPEGFDVKLFAGEPDIVQPIALCLDDRGRLWVAEAYSYPIRRDDRDAKDRILVFEDTDGDGTFDKRTVFMEGLNLVSGLEVGFGGVWIGAAPYLLFVPMKDDRPAGPPQVLLDGFGWQDTHETLNSFIWGPDGWLYGCHGVFTHSRVGKPGTPDRDRIPINAGIWRYHPTRHVFELFAEGTSNPWGVDFNDKGQAFCSACVIPHCYQLIQGGRYQRQAGTHFNPFTYDDIKTCADHVHYAGSNPHGGNNRSDSAGGGHAHCGLLCYQGGAWPKEFRGQLLMGNLHGHRINTDAPHRKGSGYVVSHAPDFLLANDAWARFINMRSGPDGNVYLLDWYDKQACHHGDPRIWDQSNGRIYKLSYRGTKPVQVDLSKKTDAELAELQRSNNEWYVRHARRLLQERRPGPAVRTQLEEMVFGPDVSSRLHGLWALHATGGLSAEHVRKGLQHEDEYVRAWTIQLGLDGRKDLVTAERLAELATGERSPAVRLYLAAALQRLPLDKRAAVLDGLLRWPEDASDHNLPLMYWYALEPLAGSVAHRAAALDLARRAPVPILFAYTVRRIASDANPEALQLLLSAREDEARTLVLLREINTALKGRPHVEAPPGWTEAFERFMHSKDAKVAEQAMALAVAFGDSRATTRLRAVLADERADRGARLDALNTLVAVRDRELLPILYRLLDSRDLRGPALRALAGFDAPEVGKLILARYPALNAAEKRDALYTLASRVSYAGQLLDALQSKQVLPGDVTADIVRAMRGLHDSKLDRRIGDVWGAVRDTPADRAQLIAHYRKLVSAPTASPRDPARGHAIFTKVCQQCHTLFGEGGKVGPDITGANRGDLGYLLENIVDPSAVIPKEYAASLLELNNGRVITGIVKDDVRGVLTVVTANETLTLPAAEVASRQQTKTSMMPDDLLKNLGEDEVRDLFAYLMSPGRPEPEGGAGKDKTASLFNSKDFTGWEGDLDKTWRIEDGCIVGGTLARQTPRNQFLATRASYKDFVLRLRFKLLGDAKKGFVNSGVQIRSRRVPNDTEMSGYQADLGDPTWWGSIYDESRRNKVLAQSDMDKLNKVLRRGDWNEYEIRAEGRRIRTFINGVQGVDYTEPDASIVQDGLIGLQVHGGGPTEVWFKDITIQELPPGR